MQTYRQIFENNKKWIAEKKLTDKQFFENLANDQNPDFLYIGCSDSRVSAEEMMGLNPGEVFVHRNVANVVCNNDLNAISVIDFAVTYLKVKHIVVCGHYFCGGVKAALQAQDMGILNPWLRNIRDVYRFHKEELNAIKDEKQRYDRLVELNVVEQCLNVIKTSSMQKVKGNPDAPLVHGWVFNLRSGELIDLEIDFLEKFKDIQKIYNLGSSY